MTTRGAVVLLTWWFASVEAVTAQARTDALPDPITVCQPAADGRQPVIDVHLHATSADGVRRRRAELGVDEDLPVPQSDRELIAWTVAELDRHNIVTAIITGSVPELMEWTASAPGRLIAATSFRDSTTSLDSLRALHRSGLIKAFAEVNFQREGRRPDDPEFDKYFALAEELDLPVGIHLYGGGAPGRSAFRVTLGDPILLEEVLVRHPRLRVYIMHAGLPFLDHTLAIMQRYPGV